MLVKEFLLVNEEKVERALNGSVVGDGTHKGGVSKTDGTYDDGALLAEYDKLGGLIKKGSDNVKTGSFYDFKAKKPKATPEIVFTYMINGKVVEVKDGTELPGIVKAAKILAEEEEAPKKKKGKRVIEE